MPDSMNLPGLAPVPSRPANAGATARAERRWRNVEWVDFTSDPDSAASPAPADVPSPVLPAKPSGIKRGAPGLGGALRHFTRMAVTRGGRRGALSGLPARFN